MSIASSGRGPPTVVAALLVLVLAAMIAIAPGGTPAWQLVQREGTSWWPAFVHVAALCGVGLLAIGVAALAVHALILARRPDAPSLRATLLRTLPIATVTLVVLSLVTIGGLDPDADRASRPFRDFQLEGGPATLWGIIDSRSSRFRPGEDRREPEQPGDVVPDRRRNSRLLHVVSLLAVLAAAAVAARWIIDRRRALQPDRFSLEEPPDVRQEAVHDAVVSTIDGMLSDPDPRTAIIGAYARLLQGLQEGGAGRREHEAPMEHLRRVLATVHVRPRPLRELIELFEIARFSSHLLSVTHRERALDALRAVAADLRGITSTTPPR